jgi:hypothetical protein
LGQGNSSLYDDGSNVGAGTASPNGFQVNLSIRNIGNLDAPASLVRFYLSEDTAYAEGRDALLKACS